MRNKNERMKKLYDIMKLLGMPHPMHTPRLKIWGKKGEKQMLNKIKKLLLALTLLIIAITILIFLIKDFD